MDLMDGAGWAGDGRVRGEVMKASVNDWEVSATGRPSAWPPLSFHWSCQLGLMRPSRAPVLGRDEVMGDAADAAQQLSGTGDTTYPHSGKLALLWWL